MKNIQMKYISPVIILFISLLLNTGCSNTGKHTEKDVKEETGHADEHINGNTVFFTAEQIKTIGIETGSIEEKQLTASIRANGALRVPNQNKAGINSLYSGIIRSLLIQPGNPVKKGQVIATIANPEFIRVQEEFLAITPRIVLAEQEFNRQKELNEGNAGALKNLQAAETELRSLNTRKSALEQQIRLMGINPAELSVNNLISVLSLRTPISGIVSNVAVKMGSYIDMNTSVAEVVDNSQLHLDLFVYEKDLPKLRNNQEIHFTVTNNPGKEYDAQIFSLGSTFEDETKAVSVHARVKGDKTGLIDGMNITALISLDKITTPAVPDEAIVSFKGQDYVFVVTEQHTHNESADQIAFEKIPVAKGVSEVGFTQISLLKPIPGHAKIVTKGAFFVLAKLTNTGEGEHEH